MRTEAAKYIGLAIKAGAAAFGLDALKSQRVRGVKLIIADTSLSEKSKKEVGFFAEKRRAPLIFFDGLGESISDVSIKIVSITDINLAKQIEREQKGE